MRTGLKIRISAIYYALAVLGGLLFWGCDSDNAWDCFQASGPIVQRTFNVDKFKKIIIWNRVQLIVSSGPQQSVVVESWENLIN